MKKKKYPWNKLWKNENSGAEDEVYAGPEYFERQQPDEPEEEELRGMECVYAGPEFFERRPVEPRKEEKRRAMEGVYAGPPVPPPMMCTYAGPEFYNGTNTRQPIGAPAPVPAANSAGFCAACGSPVGDKDKFCTNCDYACLLLSVRLLRLTRRTGA